MKKFQIKTHGNKNLARAIQEKLFELGYEWADSGRNITCLDEHTYGVGQSRGDGKIQFCVYSEVDASLTITLDELFAMTSEPKETIKIGDSTYDKKEFEEATKNLTPIN